MLLNPRPLSSQIVSSCLRQAFEEKENINSLPNYRLPTPPLSFLYPITEFGNSREKKEFPSEAFEPPPLLVTVIIYFRWRHIDKNKKMVAKSPGLVSATLQIARGPSGSRELQTTTDTHLQIRHRPKEEEKEKKEHKIKTMTIIIRMKKRTRRASSGGAMSGVGVELFVIW